MGADDPLWGNLLPARQCSSGEGFPSFHCELERWGSWDLGLGTSL